MERINTEYGNMGIKVLAAIQMADTNRLASFESDYGRTSYTVLADPEASVEALYSVSNNPATLILDRSGTVRFVAGFVPWADLAEQIESISGDFKEADLSSVESALKSLKAPESYVRWKAARALGELGDKSVAPYLAAAMEDRSASVREFAMLSLGRIGADDAIDIMTKALEDESELIRLAAVETLRGMADHRTITPLVKSLADARLQGTAADALADIGEPELVSAALEENSAFLRRAGGQAYWCLGLAYAGREMYQAAIPVLKQAVDLASDGYTRERYVSSLAYSYFETGETSKALDEYLKVLRAASAERTSVTMSYGDGRFERFNEREWVIRGFLQTCQSRNILAEVTEALEARLSESPDDMILCEMLAGVYDSKKEYQKAIPVYEKMLEMRSGSAKHYARLAVAYSRSGMPDEVARTVKEMAKRVSDDAFLYSLMGEIYIECQMQDEALEAYRKAIVMVQSDWERQGYQFGLAKCYEDTGKYAEALEEYEKLAASSPAYMQEQAESRLWEVYRKGSLYDAAIKKYREKIEANPEDVQSRELLARAYRESGDLEGAVGEYEEIVRLKPGDAGAMETLADLFRKSDDPEKAIAHYKIAAGLAPDNSSLLVKLGDTYRSMGMAEEAEAEYVRSQAQAMSVILEGSTDPLLYDSVARFFIQKNIKPSEAVSLAQKAVELAPDNLRFTSTLAAAYGKGQKARELWAKTGFVTDENWLVIGPFDNTDNAGFARSYPPEQAVDVNATYKGKDKEAAWTPAKDGVADAYVDFNAIYDEADWAAAYAFARITSPEEREAQLRVGSDDGVKVWLNGEAVLSMELARSVDIDQDVVPVKLKKGVNEILVKVCDQAVDWGFYLRITDMEGKPCSDLTYTHISLK